MEELVDAALGRITSDSFALSPSEFSRIMFGLGCIKVHVEQSSAVTLEELAVERVSFASKKCASLFVCTLSPLQSFELL